MPSISGAAYVPNTRGSGSLTETKGVFHRFSGRILQKYREYEPNRAVSVLSVEALKAIAGCKNFRVQRAKSRHVRGSKKSKIYSHFRNCVCCGRGLECHRAPFEIFPPHVKQWFWKGKSSAKLSGRQFNMKCCVRKNVYYRKG